MEPESGRRIIRQCKLLRIESGMAYYRVDYPQENRQTVVKIAFPHKEIVEETCEGKWQIQYEYASMFDRVSQVPSSYTKYLFNPTSSNYDILDFRAERVEIKEGGRLKFRVKDTGEIQLREVFDFSSFG